ncbi:MAG: cyclase family protein [Gulosibacter sp.]|uniref:cyclase family protein n=1 Tax=Gulosibacter sp. TaxID=2817531 RepID=UPI003F938D58
MTLVDLSQPIESGMTVFPGDPLAEVLPATTIAMDGFAVREIHGGTHMGTHVDAPSHIVAGGRTIPEIALEELTGRAIVVAVPSLEPDAVIGESLVSQQLPNGLDGARIVLLATGWDRYWGTPAYLSHPRLDIAACELLIDMGMHVLGVDMLNPDSTLKVVKRGLPVHDRVLGSDRLIIENLRGLTALPRFVQFWGFPLLIADGDGAPMRAVADIAQG